MFRIHVKQPLPPGNNPNVVNNNNNNNNNYYYYYYKPQHFVLGRKYEYTLRYFLDSCRTRFISLLHYVAATLHTLSPPPSSCSRTLCHNHVYF